MSQPGQLRYSFSMVRAMFALYRLSNRARIPPHNCRPQWVHLLSSSCVPVRPCSEFHAWLSERPGVSRLSAGRRSSARVIKASQWSTLWSTLAQRGTLALSSARSRHIHSFTFLSCPCPCVLPHETSRHLAPRTKAGRRPLHGCGRGRFLAPMA